MRTLTVLLHFLLLLGTLIACRQTPIMEAEKADIIVPATDPVLRNNYQDAAGVYHINLPTDWLLKELSNGAVKATSPTGQTNAYRENFTIQPVREGLPYRTDTLVIRPDSSVLVRQIDVETFAKKQLDNTRIAYDQVKLLEMGELLINGKVMRQYVYTYHDPTAYADQLKAIVYVAPDGTSAVYTLSAIELADNFSKSRRLFEQIVQTWRFEDAF